MVAFVVSSPGSLLVATQVASVCGCRPGCCGCRPAPHERARELHCTPARGPWPGGVGPRRGRGEDHTPPAEPLRIGRSSRSPVPPSALAGECSTRATRTTAATAWRVSPRNARRPTPHQFPPLAPLPPLCFSPHSAFLPPRCLPPPPFLPDCRLLLTITFPFPLSLLTLPPFPYPPSTGPRR